MKSVIILSILALMVLSCSQTKVSGPQHVESLDFCQVIDDTFFDGPIKDSLMTFWRMTSPNTDYDTVVYEVKFISSFPSQFISFTCAPGVEQVVETEYSDKDYQIVHSQSCGNQKLVISCLDSTFIKEYVCLDPYLWKPCDYDKHYYESSMIQYISYRINETGLVKEYSRIKENKN